MSAASRSVENNAHGSAPHRPVAMAPVTMTTTPAAAAAASAGDKTAAPNNWPQVYPIVVF